MVRYILFATVPAVVAGLLLPGGAEPTSTAPATTPTWQKTPHGEIAFIPLKNAPFPAESRKNGFKGNKQFFPFEKHYNDSTVGFVIPPGYKPSSEVDLIVHFHGFYNHVAKELDEYHFAEMLDASGKNVILLLPQGPYEAADSGCGKLELAGGLKRFVDEAVEDLIATGKLPREAKVRNLVLSGHSGAYRVIGFCLRHGGMEDHIRAVWLWDSTYGMLEDFSGWLARPKMKQSEIDRLLAAPEPQKEGTNDKKTGSEQPANKTEHGSASGSSSASSKRESSGPPRQLFSIFTAHLAENNAVLMSMVQKLGLPFGVWRDFDFDAAIHSPLPARFVTTTLAHDEVMSKKEFFRQAIAAATFLDPRK